MNGDHRIPSNFKAMIEECALRATEEDLEGIPDRERFRVISNEAGLLIYIIVRATHRMKIAELAGAGGSASTLAWLAGAACENGGEVTSWETNPRRMLKLQNSLCRSRLSPNVNLCSMDPLWDQGDGGVIAPPEEFECDRCDPVFDCIALSLSEPDCFRRLELAWDLLLPDGLLILTDTLSVDDECSRAVSEFLATKTPAVVGIRTAEGLALGCKVVIDGEISDTVFMDRKSLDRLKELQDMDRKNRNLFAIPPETGKFLWILAHLTNAKQILEIGSGSGYSGTWLAKGMRPDGLLTSIEMDPKKIFLAHESYKLAGIDERVTLMKGDAFEILPGLEESFDFIFLDSEKADYYDLLEYIIPLLKDNGLLVADNVISHAYELKLYLDTVEHTSSLASATAAVGSGEELTLKL
jgi:predicted O-methyltransferase YrrM